MSFANISTNPGSRAPPSPFPSTPLSPAPQPGQLPTPSLTHLTDSILTLQKNITLLTTLSPTALAGGEEQLQYEIQLDVTEQLYTRITTTIKSTTEEVMRLPRTEAARVRAGLSKLGKDLERVYKERGRVVDEVRRRQDVVKVRTSGGEGGSGNVVEVAGVQVQMQAQTEDVTLAMIRERDDEIRNINKEMQTVSEIFKDLAHIVDEQQGEIDNIETLMEQSNVHAKAGLEQVQKANEYQPGCSVM